MADETPRGGTTLIDTVADWLVEQSLSNSDIETLAAGCFNRLRAAGIPLMRAHLAFRTLHPLFTAMRCVWKRDGELVVEGLPHGADTFEDWVKSVHYYMIENRIPLLRRRLTGEEATLDFPFLVELRDQGASDYLAYLVEYGEHAGAAGKQDGMVGSWVTDRAGGFSDADIQSLIRIQTRLAVACKVVIKDQIASNVLTAYLGPDAGRKVLAGNIKRGDGERIHAAILYSDLRNSTGMADQMPERDFLAVLNSYFECAAGAILAHDGEVLRFIGDAVLAIFPIGGGRTATRKACKAALAAARDAQARMVEVNRQRAEDGSQALAFGIGLHVGDVMYGNIGVPERLEFSVVGPAANEVTRIEGLTKTLERRILASGEFAGSLAVSGESMGRHELRGVGESIEVFAFAED